MTIQELKKQIVTKSPHNFYVFVGDEQAVQDIYIEMLADARNLPVVRADSVASIVTQLYSKSIMQKYACYVIRDDKDFLSTESAWDKVISNVGKNILIIQLSKFDKRLKFYTKNKGYYVEFEKMSTDVLIRRFSKICKLSEEQLRYLIYVCENDYGRINFELDKIVTYAQALNVTQSKAFEMLVESNGLPVEPASDIFSFIDDILDYEQKDAVFNYYEMLNSDADVNSLGILTVLYNNAKAVLQVQSCESSNVSKTTGLTPWQVKCAQKHRGRLRNSDLIELMSLCQQQDFAIKSGEIPAELAIWVLMFRFF